jgi:predicted extracellular nuclease
MKLIRIIPGLLGVMITIIILSGTSHNNNTSGNHYGGELRRYRVLFYNTENFFEPADDSLTDDDDFTPAGDLHWTTKRYYTKLRNIYKVLIAAGDWQPLDIIGFCEVENKQVLHDLTNHTPLIKYPYHIIHFNSEDQRGIDVALLYNSNTVRCVESKKINIRKEGSPTRDILWFKAILNKDTCYFLINHWPSRSGGQLETEPGRLKAAAKLKAITDSLFLTDRWARIIIMGDFNDEPADESLISKLKANTDIINPQAGSLYNLSVAPEGGNYRGTLKYQGQWNLFDQIIVSGSMLHGNDGLHVNPDGYRIFGKSFLLTPDEQYTGFKPFRTYTGFRYQGGFSDHLPVYIDVTSSE